MGWLIMKYIKKGFSVFLSLFIVCTLVFDVHVHAENEGEQPATIETNESNSNEVENYGGIISDDANDVPSYQSDVQTYSEIPSSYQFDETKYPEVRNQGSYGTCWAFAALGLSEFDLINKGLADKTIDLSELQLAYYTYNSAVDPLGGTSGDQSTYYNDAADYSYLNRGGMYEYAVRRLSQWSGAVSESDVPYNTSNINGVLNNGLSSEYAYSKDVAHLENAYVMSLKNNTDDVKKAIMNNGAVGVQYYHSDSYLLWNSTQQLWTYYSPSVSGGGHNVMIVGWDDNFSKDNFVGDKPSNDGAWLIRNSWGFTQSYFWMSYENQSLLDAAWAFDMNAANNYDNNYQLDGGIDTYNVSNTICQYKTYSNVFTVQKKDGISSEKLDAVSLSFTHVANVNYKIEIYTDLKSDNPYSGTKQESATTEGSTTYAGLYTISLNSSIQLKPGTSFAVVVTTDSYSLDYEQGITWELDGTKIWDSPVSLNSGKSFYGNSNYQWSWYWGNFCIKAFTTNNPATCTNHTWSEGTITTSPTCTQKGVKTFTCTTCGTTKTEEVTALGHDYSTEWTTDVEATCTTEGSKSHHCTRDGCSAKTGDASIPKTNHEYSSEWTIDKEATCQEEGSKSHHCIHCDAKTDVTTISKTDHNWDSGTVTKAVTCTTTGVKTYTCKTCKTTKVKDINALGHSYSTDYTVDKEATCTVAGSKSRHCTHDGCNEKIEETSIPAKGHSWNSGVVTKKATYNQNGTIQYTCKTCGTQKNDSIAKLSNRTESVTYRTHVQDYGWQSWKTNGESSGTSGQSKRLEGIHIKINNKSVNGNIMYRTHVQNIGWQGWKSNGDMSGTSGQSLRLEAIQIKLTDELANSYDIYYRVHAQDYGWLDWAKNGESAGTEGKSKRLEAIQIKLVPKGNSAPGSTSRPFVFDMVSYRTHVQDYGWQSYVSDGTMSGTSGKSKRLEGINIKLSSSIDGGIQYRTHVQDYGWQNWVQNNQMSGTSGKSKRLEAIQIRLTGNIANQYDVYYRVHCQDFGWLGWAKNGESSGSEGYSKRLEGIQVVLVKKGSAAPGNTANHFYKR